MPSIGKVTSLITRHGNNGPEVCVFDHPRAGTQLPAGTLLPGEAPAAGALREGFEETGLTGLRVAGDLGELETMERRHLVHLVVDEPAADEWYVVTPDGGGHCWRCHWMPITQADLLVSTQQEWLDRARPALLQADHPVARRRPHPTGDSAAGTTIEIFWAPPWSGTRALMSWLDASADIPVDSIHRAECAAFTDAGQLLAVCDGHSELWTLPGGRREAGESAEPAMARELAEEACARMEFAELIGYQRFHHLDGSRAGQVTIDALFRASVSLDPFVPRFETGARRLFGATEALVFPLWANPITQKFLLRAINAWIDDLRLDLLTMDDLPQLDWSGGPANRRGVAAALARAARGEVEYLAIRTPNGAPVSKAGIDYAAQANAGTLWQLATRPDLQGRGLATRLIAEGERRIRSRGLNWAVIGVEDNNPRARALYERLGYSRWRGEQASWQEDDGRGGVYLYRTEVTLLRKRVAPR